MILLLPVFKIRNAPFVLSHELPSFNCLYRLIKAIDNEQCVVAFFAATIFKLKQYFHARPLRKFFNSYLYTTTK